MLDEIRNQLLQHYPSDSESPVKIGGISFIHRFGSSLNAHAHFHCVIIEGVFVKNSDSQITFHKLSTLTEEDIQAVQEHVRLRVLKSFKRSGLLEEHDVENMKTWNGGGGFSVNGTAYIHENDREGLERLLRYCARPPFALELIDKLAAWVPPPRIHRHRYYGVLAPNSPIRASVTAMLLARSYNLFPLLCPECGAEMQVIAVIQDKPVINKILESVGEATQPPSLSPARGPPNTVDLRTKTY